MFTARFKYAHPSDNVAALATITTSSEQTLWPKARLADGDPSTVFKMEDNEGWILYDFGSPQRVDCPVIFHHDLGETDPDTTNPIYEVLWQGNATNAWDDPALEELFLIHPVRDDGMRNNPPIILTEKDGYSINGYRFWRAYIVGAGAPVDNVAIGEIGIYSQLRSLDDAVVSAVDTPDHPVVSNRTDGLNLLVYDKRITYERWNIKMKVDDPTEREKLRAWYRATSHGYRRFPLIPDPDVSEAYLCRFIGSQFPSQLASPTARTFDLTIEEDIAGEPF